MREEDWAELAEGERRALSCCRIVSKRDTAGSELWVTLMAWADWAEEQSLGYEAGLREMVRRVECPAWSEAYEGQWVYYNMEMRKRKEYDADDIPEEVFRLATDEEGVTDRGADRFNVYYRSFRHAVKAVARVRSRLLLAEG